MSGFKNIKLYSTEEGNVNLQVVFNNDTFWLTQKEMTQLFGVGETAFK